MEPFFARFDGATWPQQGRLHVYALGNEPLRRAFETYHRHLVTTGVAEHHGLGLQPGKWAHFTVQMTLRSIQGMPAGDYSRLATALAETAVSLPSLTLQVGAPRGAGRYAVELAVDPVVDRQWTRMVEAIRGAISDALGPEVLPPPGSNSVPHTSIGYGTGEGDSGAITDALNSVRLPAVTVPVTELHLVAVTQYPSEGRFAWSEVATLPLQG